MWKNSMYKWDSWIANRHKDEKKCDDWSRTIIEGCEGKTVVVNCGGMFFSDFISDLTVVEFFAGPVNVPGIEYINKGVDYDQEFDNLIMVNPQSLRFHTSILDFLTIPRLCRNGKKPNFLKWLKRPAKIFLSTSDWYLYYNRLKYTVPEVMARHISELNQSGIFCEYVEISDVNKDMVNGNIKLILSVQK